MGHIKVNSKQEDIVRTYQQIYADIGRKIGYLESFIASSCIISTLRNNHDIEGVIGHSLHHKIITGGVSAIVSSIILIKESTYTGELTGYNIGLSATLSEEKINTETFPWQYWTTQHCSQQQICTQRIDIKNFQQEFVEIYQQTKGSQFFVASAAVSVILKNAALITMFQNKLVGSIILGSSFLFPYLGQKFGELMGYIDGKLTSISMIENEIQTIRHDNKIKKEICSHTPYNTSCQITKELPSSEEITDIYTQSGSIFGLIAGATIGAYIAMGIVMNSNSHLKIPMALTSFVASIFGTRLICSVCGSIVGSSKALEIRLEEIELSGIESESIVG